MSLFLLNLLLAFIWAAATGSFTLGSLLVGFGLGYVCLLFVQGALGPSTYPSKVRTVVSFMAFFAWEIIRANLRVAYEVITPGRQIRPGVVAVPLDAKTDIEITLLANLTGMTPGTLSMDVSDDKSVLYMHVMFLDDVEEFRREIKQGFERRLLEVLR